MKPTPFLEEILQLITEFLLKAGHDKLAAKLESTYTLPAWV